MIPILCTKSKISTSLFLFQHMSMKEAPKSERPLRQEGFLLFVCLYNFAKASNIFK